MRVGFAILGLLAVGSATLGFLHWREQTAARSVLAPLPGETELVVPHVRGSITLDGDLDDSGWLGPIAHTGAFVDKNGAGARPYSEARITWGDDVLYLSFYAADEDIRAAATDSNGEICATFGSPCLVTHEVWKDDSFHFVLDDGKNERIFDASVNAILSTHTRPSSLGLQGETHAAGIPWQSGAFISREVDGTLNDARDDDEEWALEIAIPLEALGLRGEAGERVRFAAHRCDLTKTGKRVCASWGERSPAVLVLQ